MSTLFELLSEQKMRSSVRSSDEREREAHYTGTNICLPLFTIYTGRKC